MQISQVKNAIFVGEIVNGTRPYKGSKHVLYTSKLVLNYDSSLPKELKTKCLSIVYIFCVNGKIYKIGQSSGAGGIKSCMGFYLDGGMDASGENRFTINWLIRDELDKGNKIEVYMIYMDSVLVEVPGLINPKQVEVPVSAKGIEQNCLEEYYQFEKSFPCWNFQENNNSPPNEIKEAYGQYKIDRVDK
jgi:hypothetical protein